MNNINPENEMPRHHVQLQHQGNHHQEKEEANQLHDEESEQLEDEPEQITKESEQLGDEPEQITEESEQLGDEPEQITEESGEEEEEQKEEKKLSRGEAPPLTTMPSSPPLSPMSPPPNRPASPPDHPSYPAHVVSPPPSTLSSYKTTYSYNYSHVESSPPPQVLKSPPSPPPSAAKLEGVEEAPGADRVAGSGRKLRPVLRRGKTENIKRRSLLVLRIFGFLFCLVSLSVMGADKNQGWALDSFHRYKELRYCMSVNVIGFVYSGLQAYDVAYSLTSGKQVVRNRFRCLLDFSLDQILAYLLLSASSSSAFRVEDWESNWGKDKFPAMARASVALSFLAFLAFALSSLLSGYTLFTPHS